MSSVFVIEHPNGAVFASPYGWVPRPEIAYRFATSFDAQSHIQITRMDPMCKVVPAEFQEDAQGNRLHNVETDYDPFGLGRQ